MRRTERNGRLLIAAAITAIASSLTVTPATASEDPAVSYSVDGVTWSASPPSAILPAGWIAVPGASQHGILHLRAERPGATLIALFAAPASANDPVVIEALRVTGEGDRAVVVDGSRACSTLAPQTVLRQGETMQVPIGVALDADLIGGQDVSVSLDVLVVLSDTASVPLPNGCPVDPAVIPLLPGQAAASATMLSHTGTDLPLVAGAAAIAAVIGGVVAIRRGGSKRA